MQQQPQMQQQLPFAKNPTDELANKKPHQNQMTRSTIQNNNTNNNNHKNLDFTDEEIQEKSKIKYDKNCEEGASFMSKLLFTWTGKIMAKGAKLSKENKYLQNEDLYDCKKEEQPLFAYNFMEENLIKQIRQLGRQDLHEEAEFVKKCAEEKMKRRDLGEKGVNIEERPLRQRKIVEKVLKMLGLRTYLIAGAFAIISNLLQFAGPILLNRILDYMEESNTEPAGNGYLYASLIFVSFLIRTFLLQHSLHLVNLVGMKVLNGLSSSIYTKILRVASSTRKYFDTGKTMNLVSVDAQSILGLIMLGTFLMSSPIMIIVSMALIIAELGPIGLITPVFFFVGSYIQKKINTASFALRRILLTYTDKRSKSVNEFFEGIRVIKYYAWEDMVSERIFNIRQGEMKNLMKSQILKSLIEVTMNVTPLLMSVLVFGLYAGFYSDFTPSKAFMVLSLFNLLLIPLRMVTMVLMFYLNAKASMSRIEFYLMSEEREENVVIRDDENQEIGQISITDGHFAWESITSAIHNEQGKNYMNSKPAAKKGQDNKNSKSVNSGQNAVPSTNTLATQNDQFIAKEDDLNKLSPLEEQSLKNLNILKNINLQVEQGEMIAIVGQVASGKSSLLHALLGEMMKNQGEVRVKGKVAYVPQTAWLQNATLRDNILFGMPYDEKKYNNVIDKCQLRQEIENGEVLPGGDMTEIGERGINLSGGQKQRVAIARALYADADIYIIDDCLSALDAHVGKNVFEQVLKGDLKNKTVLFVTHALHYMPEVQKIIVMKEGQIVETGSHDYLRKNGQEYIRLNQIEQQSELDKSSRMNSTAKKEDIQLDFDKIDDEQKDEHDEETKEIKRQLVEEKSQFEDPNLPSGQALEQKQRQSDIFNESQRIQKRANSETKSEKIEKDKKKQEDEKNMNEKKIVIGKAVQKEERATGAVPSYVYKKYINYSGAFTTVIMLLCFLSAQGFKMIADWWIGQWSSNAYDISTGGYIGIYGVFSVCSGIFIFLRGYAFGVFSLKSSQSFQQSLLNKLLHTPLWWFDITPTGRIVARTSKDQDDLDSTLPWNMQFALTNVIQLIATCIMIGVILPLFFIVFVIAFIIYIKVISYYLISAREIKRLEANTRAPVISHFQESINGLYVIRAFGKEREFVEKMLLTQRDYIVSFTNMNYTNRWISVITDLFALVIISGTAYFGVLSKDFNYQSNSSLIGLALSWSFQISTILSFTLKLIADTESGMNAVVRMLQYIDKNPQENSWRDKKAPENWPNQGEYKMENITYKYREELPSVINGISFEIKKNEKIGVVGRTGSGKSTLTLGLMRILELVQDPNGKLGKISLDNENIRDIGLHELREKVTIIPQDPLLFTGTIKSNIDPFGKHSQEQIADVLKKVEIWDQLDSILNKQLEKENKDKPNQNGSILNNPNFARDQLITKKLDIKVEGGGSNFSLGQRQLICIARAIIKKPSVLLMDEATASIDEMTDRLIQNMIKKELTNTTVITIAHRLKTIIQYDKILVLDLGNLKELNTPISLLNDKNGYFYKLVSSHGKEFQEEMQTLAQNKEIDVY